MDIVLSRKDLFLEKTRFYEYISDKLIDKILKCNKIRYIEYKKFDTDLWYTNLKFKNIKINDPEHHLRVYRDNCFNNILETRYKKLHYPWGRLYPELSVVILKAYIRRTLVREDYYDFDLIGTHLYILKNLCCKYGIECSTLKRIILERDNIIDYLIKKYKLEKNSKTTAKDMIFLNMYIEEESEWGQVIKMKYKIDAEYLDIFREFKREMDYIKMILIEKNPVLYEYCERTFPEIRGKTFMNTKNILGRDKLSGYFLSLYLQEQEVRIVDKIMEYLYHNTNVMKIGTKNGFCIYEYDGFMLLKKNVDREFGGPDKLVELLNRKTKEMMDIDWICKPIDDNVIEFDDIYMDYENIIYVIVLVIIICLIYIK